MMRRWEWLDDERDNDLYNVIGHGALGADDELYEHDYVIYRDTLLGTYVVSDDCCASDTPLSTAAQELSVVVYA